MGTFVNATDIDLSSRVFGSTGIRSVLSNEERQQEEQQFNNSSELSQRFQPLNKVGGELIKRYASIDRLENEVETRNTADEKLGELKSLLEDPTKENLAAAEDVLKDLKGLAFTNSLGKTEEIISAEDSARIRFDIPGKTLERLDKIIQENDKATNQAEKEITRQENDLNQFIENQGVQTGQSFTSQAEVITSFLNVERTGQLLDVFY